MDETRAQAYLQLIQTLLTCPNGDEPQILQANLELLDRGFLEACEVIAATLTQQGQENAASFLQNLASQLGQFLDANDEGDSDNSESEDSEEYEKFIRELLQAEQDSNSDIKVIYPMLIGRQHLLNHCFAETLQQVAQKLIAEHPEAIESIVATIGNLSIDISNFPLGSRSNNIEIAITGYEIVLNHREAGSEDWAGTQNNLAVAYSDRIRGEKAENIELAISSYIAALSVRTREAFPEKWAETQNNLANAYCNRIRGDKAENIEGASASFNGVLEVYTREAFPEKWAGTQNNLGLAYCNRIRGDKAENIEMAIASFNAALTVYKPDAFPEDWAMTQNNLAAAYYDRIRGEKAENIEMAISFYIEALSVYTCDAFPQDWATTKNNLANAYSNRIREEKAENIEGAISLYNAALSVRTREAFPEKWAETQNNLGIAYSNRIREEKAENIEMAIASFNAALSVYTYEAFPQDWAMTQNNLATAYSDRIRGEEAENIERAISFYIETLEVYTLDTFPQNWAQTQNNLGLAYCNRIREEKAENIEMAIASFNAVLLEVYTRNAFPENHAGTLFNLGIAYQKLPNLQLAYNTFADAIDHINFLRGEIYSGDKSKQKLAEEWNQLYLNMVEVCIQLQRYTKAVEYADRSKGQNLIELLSVKDLYPKGEIPDALRRELQQLRLRIAEENQRLKQAEVKNYDTINQLRQDLAAKYPYTPLKFGEIKQLADEKTAIVEWYILIDSFCAFIITNDDSELQLFSFDKSDLEKLIDWGNEYLGDYDSNRQQWQNSLETKLPNLAQILHIDEIVNAIPKTCDKLILIPHRYLHLLPLHALPLTNNTAKYLIDAFPGGVSYAPSCQILHQVQKYERGKFDKLFAIQNPKDNLRATDMEVETIKKIFLNSEILAKGNAKKGKPLDEKLEIAEKAADSHHLFFSCHASFDRDNPLQSGLQLADDTLTLEEIIGYFNLSECSLVTLSACETGQVQLDNTDEYISLTNGFLLAGSPSLYVSLWSVNAFSTAILLIKTYENLYFQPGKFALALSQAQIWMRDTDIQGFLDWTNQCYLLDDTWREFLQDCLEEEKETQGFYAKIYQNPYHWAGFCAAGKGEQNMTNSITPLEIFQDLIQESDLFVNLREDLIYLKGQLTNNDEENIEIVENWLQDKPEIRRKYRYKLMSGDKLGNNSQSDTKPGQATKSLIERIENLTIPVEKPPEQNKDTQPSP
ncbi:MAG: tetratricopeptide repeat protein [Microcoleus sp. PH2017_29_MFU_D_A]|uniref:CHAT domain-containing protein n=1 Tax=unclassified Microcoleus TaxID=2642155 RepID=UPI001D7DD47F|nr:MULTISPECIES: CHAT domain-containing protein [unclassified Microcoleus]MCC3465293.1 tetratricopeptide repeat protein [Microcoleus sp. PH2017_06_SFM_O_A]TAE52537.1 MAG: CHAT domain-containing protein [Oscillatoriales cyanobacterium]MCC3471623.1 tetratricopeptide repeat protein [Microcoleus sp. PH2017_13_LAR_U_A]MCC3483499.1 tetratricopeptide repeat protein [Microcoleus sp. PH2017_14_LAR_D_A]MCC3497057.1 tetratricopeptide repeat protein [Microcoleus sp. PH2017_15_JOR_U_A]